MSARTVQPPALNEAAWQRQVIDLAHLYGWRVAHFRAAQTAKGWRTPVEADGAGFPDLVLVRGIELIFAELKAERGRLQPSQQDWLEALEEADADVYVWKPSQFDEVNRRLSR